MKIRLKATVTTVAEYDVDLGTHPDDLVDFRTCDVFDHEKAKLILDPVLLLYIPSCQTFAKVEEVK